jgi:hypothetical protein
MREQLGRRAMLREGRLYREAFVAARFAEFFGADAVRLSRLMAGVQLPTAIYAWRALYTVSR